MICECNDPTHMIRHMPSVPVSGDSGERSCCRSDTPDRSQSRVQEPGVGTPAPGTHSTGVDCVPLDHHRREVESLREQGGLLVEALDDKDGEVERLRESNNNLRVDVAVANEEVNERGREIERLRGALRATESTLHDYADDLRKAKDEIGRLRLLRDAAVEDRNEGWDEVERLREVVNDMYQSVQEALNHRVEEV